MMVHIFSHALNPGHGFALGEPIVHSWLQPSCPDVTLWQTDSGLPETHACALGCL